MALAGKKPGWVFVTPALAIFTVLLLKTHIVYEPRIEAVVFASGFLLITLAGCIWLGVVGLKRWYAPGWRNYLWLLPMLLMLFVGTFT